MRPHPPGMRIFSQEQEDFVAAAYEICYNARRKNNIQYIFVPGSLYDCGDAVHPA